MLLGVTIDGYGSACKILGEKGSGSTGDTIMLPLNLQNMANEEKRENRRKQTLGPNASVMTESNGVCLEEYLAQSLQSNHSYRRVST